jgi:uncharacterized protein (TIGR04255 family)
VTGPDPDREIYPNAPLKLVTFEYRFEPVELTATLTEEFVNAVAEDFPIPGPPPHQQFVLGPSGPSASAAGARSFDASRRQAVLLAPQTVSYETSAYIRFEDFCKSLERLLEILASLVADLVPQRIGLRYIDEIDERHLPAGGDWNRYIDAALASPLSHFDPAPSEHQSAALFEIAQDHKVVLRYGLMRQPAVDPTGPLVIPDPPRGRYYLIDIDSAWEPSSRSEPQRTPWVLDKVGQLHAPVRQLFESSITDQLRNDVLRKETT